MEAFLLAVQSTDKHWLFAYNLLTEGELVVLHLHSRWRCVQILCVPQWISVDRSWKLNRCRFVGVWPVELAPGHTYCYTHSLLWIIAFAKIYCLFIQPHFKTKPGRYSSHLTILEAYFLEHCWQNRLLRAGFPVERVHEPHSYLNLRCWAENGTLNLISRYCGFVAGVCSLISSFMFRYFQQDDILKLKLSVLSINHS